MDINLFWNAFGAIGGTLGAVATFIAVIVALWQTKLNYKKKLKVSFSDKHSIVATNENKIINYIGLTVTNIGNREVFIKNWGYYLNNNTINIILPDTSFIGKLFQVELPYKLQIEESITLQYETNLFCKSLDICIKDSKLQPNKKIKFFVTDSTGKQYFVYTDKTASEFLQNFKK